MAKREDIVKLAKEYVQNHGVYIGAANGTPVMDLTIKDIYNLEKSYGREAWRDDIKRDLNFIARQIANGVNLDKALAGDCSGSIVGMLRTLGLIKPTADYAARHFQSMTKVVALTRLKPGDLVYNKKSEATHVGLYLGDDSVFESKGRDYGMVISKLNSKTWVIGGSFDWWEDDTELVDHDEFIFTRNLKYVADNLMRGEDVKRVQEKLVQVGLLQGSIDGIYGKNTTAAVIRYQQSKSLTPDGICGKKTYSVMGFKFA